MGPTEKPAAGKRGGLPKDVSLTKQERREDTENRQPNQSAYPFQPGHKGPSETGLIAAKRIATRATTIRARTLAVIERRNATAEEIAAEIGEHPMVVRARCSELRAQGLIEDSGDRGEGFLGGKVIRWRICTAEEVAVAAARRAADAEHGESAHG